MKDLDVQWQLSGASELLHQRVTSRVYKRACWVPPGSDKNKTLSLFTCCSQIFWQSCINTKKVAVLLCQAVHACVLCVYVMCMCSHVCSIPVLLCECVRCMYILARIKLPNSCTVWQSTCCLVLNLLKLSYRGRKILAQSRGTGSSQTGGLLGHKGSREEVILARKHWHGWVIWIWHVMKQGSTFTLMRLNHHQPKHRHKNGQF